MITTKILVCDDDQGILDVIQLMLEIEGFTVCTEIDSTKLITRIQEFMPDLILLDLWMPVLSGEQVLRTIRNIDNIQKIPVIVLSASVDGDDIAMDAGADAFVAKPFDLDDLVLKIKNLVSNKITSDQLI